MNKVQQVFQLVKNMGMRYMVFRVRHEWRRKTGWFESRFPIQPAFQRYLSLDEWKKSADHFFLSKDSVNAVQAPAIQEIKKPGCIDGNIKFFNATIKALGTDYDWVTNPATGYRYDIRQHWSKVNDFSQEAGDIKYVWEKSRFAYLYEVIRYDEHHGTDHSAWVIAEIVSWIDANPVNAGPNYKCSQEISLRILNWTFALQYYRHSEYLSDAVFDKIQYALYWQIRHVYDNIHFSRIAVRNNHAITETLVLYIIGSLYPQLPGAATWKAKGRRWFEEEIAYQVYADGTFLQYSNNYHRVVVQLFSWAIAVAASLGESFAPVVYERAYQSIRFLYAAQDLSSGYLPNYGSNDGALFFPLNSCDYRDFRPQLNALHVLLTGEALYRDGAWSEDAWWFRACQLSLRKYPRLQTQNGWQLFKEGGYAILRDGETLSFIRCGSHPNRPAQADNLHLDVWRSGENLLQDAGSYLYNTSPDLVNYFMGTASHNTIMLGSHNQMLKGSRFIWYYWTQAHRMEAGENEDGYWFRGEISCFGQLANNIRHCRQMVKQKGTGKWEITDEVINKPPTMAMRQLWHPGSDNIQLECTDAGGVQLAAKKEAGWVSEYYGVKKEATTTSFESKGSWLKTKIEA